MYSLFNIAIKAGTFGFIKAQPSAMGQKCEKFLQQPKPCLSQDLFRSTKIDMELEDDMI